LPLAYFLCKMELETGSPRPRMLGCVLGSILDHQNGQHINLLRLVPVQSPPAIAPWFPPRSQLCKELQEHTLMRTPGKRC